MVKFVNRAKMTTSTTGTGTLTLVTALSGFQSFAASGVVNADIVTYVIEDGTAWEIGNGVYTSVGTTLSRSLLSSSTGSLLVLTGNAVVYVSVISQTIDDLYATKANLASPSFTGQSSFPDGTAAAPSIAHTGDLNAGLFFPAADTVAVATAGTEAMRINSSGNVGIGKTNPAYSLEVVSDISASGFATFGRLVLRSAEGTVTAPTQITASTILGVLDFTGNNATPNSYNTIASIRGVSDGAITSTSSPGYLTFRTTPSGTVTTVERMRIDSSGNVGIGTASPAAKLEITNATAPDFRLTVGSTLTTNFYASSGGTALYTVPALPLIFGTNNTERLRIADAGQIGIGGANYGTSGQVLTSGGSGAAPSWDDRINRGTAVASTSGTAITFTGIPSWAERITILLYGVSVSSSVDLLVQIGATTFTTSGYSSASGQAQSGGTTTITTSTAGFHISDGNSAYAMSGSLVIKKVGGTLIVADGVFTSTSTMVSSSGIVSISGEIDRIRLQGVTATTFDAGTVNIMWE